MTQCTMLQPATGECGLIGNVKTKWAFENEVAPGMGQGERKGAAPNGIGCIGETVRPILMQFSPIDL